MATLLRPTVIFFMVICGRGDQDQFCVGNTPLRALLAWPSSSMNSSLPLTAR